jgi:methionyl-tRNA formyltransferase
LDQGIDKGDIIYLIYLSLVCSFCKIFNNIEFIGVEYINKIIIDYKNKKMVSYKQDDSKSTYCKRRKESDSEINIEEILNNGPVYLYNKIRSLNDPYPNAFIRCKNGKKLFLIDSKYEK